MQFSHEVDGGQQKQLQVWTNYQPFKLPAVFCELDVEAARRVHVADLDLQVFEMSGELKPRFKLWSLLLLLLLLLLLTLLSSGLVCDVRGRIHLDWRVPNDKLDVRRRRSLGTQSARKEE